MPILSSDILYKLSVTSGSAGNTVAQTFVHNSLGKYISTTQITDNVLNNLFDDATSNENTTSSVDYACFFVHNANSTLTLIAAIAWISSEVAGGANVAIGIDTTASSVISSSSVQAVTIATKLTAPSGVTFTSPTTKSVGISVGDIPAGYCKAIWVRRTQTNTVAINNDGCTIKIEGDTTI